MSKKDNDSTSSMPGNKGIIAGAIIIIAVGFFLAGFFFASGNTGASATVLPDDCGKTVISYVNTNLVQANSTATLVSVTEKNGMYQVAARYQARNVSFYTTKDCSLLFASSYNLKGNNLPTVISTSKPTTSPTPVPLPVKSAHPTTELFVMSFCPYGVQAENAMEPVVNLLGTKADIKIRYIATVNGDTVESVKSLHGLVEAKEDIRQLCIAKYYPQDLWPYVTAFNKNCQSTLKDSSSAAACGANATRNLMIDNQKVEICASGSEGIALLKADEAITSSLKITGSPTLLMNGQKFVGQRTAEAYKQGVCARFETPPAECSMNLSAQATAASGSCG